MNSQNRRMQAILSVIGLLCVAISIALTFAAPGTFWNWRCFWLRWAFCCSRAGINESTERMDEGDSSVESWREAAHRPGAGAEVVEPGGRAIQAQQLLTSHSDQKTLLPDAAPGARNATALNPI